MSYPIQVAGSGASFKLIGETKQPSAHIQDKIHKQLLNGVRALKDSVRWVAEELPTYERLIPSWNNPKLVPERSADLVDVGKLRKLILLEYCFGRLPAQP